jgi:hypothetical protein
MDGRGQWTNMDVHGHKWTHMDTLNKHGLHEEIAAKPS